MTIPTDTVRILRRADRIKNSRNGNPRWRLTFDDGSVARTRADTSMTNGAHYELDRYEGRKVLVTFDGRGYVRNVVPAVRHRYYCAECPNEQRYGPWRNLVSEANRDRTRHEREHEGHYPYI